jgi:hypothetical protein
MGSFEKAAAGYLCAASNQVKRQDLYSPMALLANLSQLASEWHFTSAVKVGRSWCGYFYSEYI